MEMALTEIFVHIMCVKCEKMPFFSLVIFIIRLQCKIQHFLVNRVTEPLVRSKMAVTLELKPCLSNFSRGIEKQKGYQGTNIEFSYIQLIYF